MRIGVNTLFMIPGEVGGTETYLRRLLVSLAEAGDDTWVLFTQNENHHTLKQQLGGRDGVEFRRLAFNASNRTARILAEQLVLPRRVRESSLDALWSPGYTAPRQCSVPQAVTIHDMQFKRHPEDLTPAARWATAVLVGMAARRCTRILADSAFAKREILHGTGVPEARVSVVPAGVDPVFFDTMPVDAQARVLGPEWSLRRPVILCVSNTYPHKNVDGLVDAFGMCMDYIPHDLVLVGQPRLGEGAVQRAMAGLSDPARVRRVPRVRFPALVALYQAADLFVFPSRYEGFGLPVLEAMASGVPVVAFRQDAVAEIGGNAVVYSDSPDAKALAVCMRDVLGEPPDRRRARIKAARQRARAFSWEAAACTVRRILHETAATTG